MSRPQVRLPTVSSRCPSLSERRDKPSHSPGVRFAHIEMLKSAALTQSQKNPEVQPLVPLKQQLIGQLKTRVKDSIASLYNDYDTNKAALSRQAQSICAQQGVQSQLQFKQHQAQAQKRLLNQLTDKLRRKQKQLAFLKAKDIQLQGADSLVSKMLKGQQEQRIMNQQAQQVQYEAAVAWDMAQFRRRLADEASDAGRLRRRTLQQFRNKIKSLQSIIAARQFKVKEHGQKINMVKGSQEKDLTQIKLRDDFKCSIEHELEELCGKTAIREMAVHEQMREQSIRQAQRQKKAAERRAIQQAEEKQQEQSLQRRLQAEQQLQKLEDEYHNSISKKTAVSQIGSLSGELGKQGENQVVLKQISERLIQIRDEKKKSVAGVGSTFDARNVEPVVKVDPQELDKLSKDQAKLQTKISRLQMISAKACLLASKLNFFVDRKGITPVSQQALRSYLDKTGKQLERLRKGK